MSLLSRLFGGGAGAKAPEASVVDYEGFRIIAEPMAAEGQFRLAAWVEKEVGGELKRHHLIRADLIRDRKECEEAAIAKAKQLIDQQGDRLFG